jgi:hypothetical protein
MSGQLVTPAGDEAFNNYRGVTPGYSLASSFGKSFIGTPGLDGMVPIGQNGYENWIGPIQGVTGQGSGLAVPGQDVISMLRWYHNSFVSSAVIVACDYWDNSLTQLHATNIPAAQRFQARASNGQAVWLSGQIGGTPSSDGPSKIDQIWYSNSAAPQAGQSCGNDAAYWTTDINDPALGNDPDLAAEGIYTGINMVRVAVSTTKSTNDVRGGAVSISLRVADGVPNGTVIPNFAAQSGTMFDADYQAILDRDTWRVSQYNPVTHVDAGYGDRLTVTNITSAINKEILQTALQGGEFTSTSTEVAVGQTRTFRLTPTLASPAATASTNDLRVEDCIPAGFDLVGSSHDYTTVRNDRSEIECAAGETYVQWSLGAFDVGDPVPAVTYEVQVGVGVVLGSYTTTAAVSATGDSSRLSYRQDPDRKSVV